MCDDAGEMNDYHVRPARRDDRRLIRRLIWRVRINPFGLHWENFLVASNDDHALLGCGQLKSHGPGSVELASIAVEEQHRGRGIARMIIERLIARAPRPLYLLCMPELTGFYARFGFTQAGREGLPRHFSRIAALAGVASRLHRSRAPVIMRLD